MSPSIALPVSTESAITTNPISVLESGDRLTRTEFERRYAALPQIKKAELVEGVVFVASPVRFREHAFPDAQLMVCLGVYCAGTPGLVEGHNATVRLDLDNVFQPDALLMIEPQFGGQSHVDRDGYVAGAPEFVVEIAASSASLDLNAKLSVYRRNQVREYLVWRTIDRQFDWFTLQGSEFVRLAPDAAGIFRSALFPGLWIDSAALLRGDLAGALNCLRDGLATAEHAEFVARLRAAGSTGS